MQTQSLSFEVRIAGNRQDLQAACRVRAQSYGHHLPHLHAMLLEPDLLDADENTFVVLCVDKASGSAVGTARFQTNAGGQLLIEHSVSVPESMRNDTRAEVTRLSAVAGADPLVKLALMKASYLFCLATQIRWMVICARSEAFVRQYRRLGFANLFDDERTVPMLHVGRLPHHVLTFNVTTAESRWREQAHPLYNFMVETAHPDIQLFSRKPALPRRDEPRRVEVTSGWEVPTRFASRPDPNLRSEIRRSRVLAN